jgi:cysteine-rich repeat protein
VWVSDSGVGCKSAGGVGARSGAGLPVVVSAGLRGGSATGAWSYDGPVVCGAGITNHPVSGALLLSIFGKVTRFNYSPHLRLGSFSVATASSVTGWLSSSVCFSKMSSGISGSSFSYPSLAVFFTIGLQKGSQTNAVSFNIPSVSSIGSSTNCPMTGSSSVTLVGFSFGLQSDASISVKIGFSSSRASFWASDSCASLKVLSGYGESVIAAVSVGQRLGYQRTRGFSYNKPVLTQVFATHSPGTSSVFLRFKGVSLGTELSSPQVRLGFYIKSSAVSGTAMRLSSWTSDSFILCRSVTGERSHTFVVVSVSRSSSSTSLLVSFSPPFIGKLSTVFMSATGSVRVYMTGNRFGIVSKSAAASISGSSSQAILWKSDTSILGKSPAGFGVSKILCFTSGMQKVHFSSPISYNSIVLQSGVISMSPTTGSLLLVTGKHFATFDVSFRSRISASSDRAFLWRSDSITACKTPRGFGNSLSLLISSNELDSGLVPTPFTATLSFDTIRVSMVRPSMFPTTGSSTSSLYGLFFGVVAGSSSIRIGLTSAENSFWISDSSLTLKSMSLVGVVKSLIGSVSKSIGSSQILSDVSSPFVRFVQPRTNGPSSGGYRVTLAGHSFGIFVTSAAARIDETACMISSWVSDTILHCRIPSGGLGSHPVKVTVNRKVSSTLSSNETIWSYDQYASACGDGFADVYQLKEDCDDSNLYNDDGCDMNCMMEISPPIDVVVSSSTKGVLAGALLEWAFPANYFRSDGVSPRPASIILEARLPKNSTLIRSAHVNPSQTQGYISGLIGGVEHLITIVVVDYKPTTRQYFFSQGAVVSVLPFNGPSEPRNVRADVLDYRLLFVSWNPPRDFGGGNVMTTLVNYVVHLSAVLDGVHVEQQSRVPASEISDTIELTFLHNCVRDCIVHVQVSAQNEYGAGDRSILLSVTLPTKPLSVINVRIDANNSAVMFDGSRSGALFWKIVGSYMFDGSAVLFELQEPNPFLNPESYQENFETTVQIPTYLLPRDVFCYVFVVSCGPKCLDTQYSPFALLRTYSMMDLMHVYPSECHLFDGCQVNAFVRGNNHLEIPSISLGHSGENAVRLQQESFRISHLGTYGAIWQLSAILLPSQNYLNEPSYLFLSFSPTIFIKLSVKIIIPVKAKLEYVQPSVICTVGGSSIFVFSNIYDASAILGLTSNTTHGISKVTLLDVRSDVGRAVAAISFNPMPPGDRVVRFKSSTVDLSFNISFASVVLLEIHPKVSKYAIPVVVYFVFETSEHISNVSVEDPFVLRSIQSDAFASKIVGVAESSDSLCIFAKQCDFTVAITTNVSKETKTLHRIQILNFSPSALFVPSFWFQNSSEFSNLLFASSDWSRSSLNYPSLLTEVSGKGRIPLLKTSRASQAPTTFINLYSAIANLSLSGSFNVDFGGPLSDESVTVIPVQRIIIKSWRPSSVTTTEPHYIVFVVKLYCDWAGFSVDVNTTTRGFQLFVKSQFCCQNFSCEPPDDINRFVYQSASASLKHAFEWSLTSLEPNSALIIAELTPQPELPIDSSTMVIVNVFRRNETSSYDAFEILARGLDQVPMSITSINPTVILSQRSSIVAVAFNDAPPKSSICVFRVTGSSHFSNVPVLWTFEGGHTFARMSVQFVPAGDWEGALVCDYLKPNGTSSQSTIARFKFRSVDETSIQQNYSAIQRTVYQPAYGLRQFQVSLGRFLISEIDALQCSWPIELKSIDRTEGFYALLTLKFIVPFSLPLGPNAIVCLSTMYSFVIAAEMKDLPSTAGVIVPNAIDVFNRVYYSDQDCNVSLILRNQIEVLEKDRFVILITNMFNGVNYTAQVADLSTSSVQTIVNFTLPKVDHDASFTTLRILCYEDVVFKNDAFPEKSASWYSEGDLVVWKRHSTLLSVFPAKCLSFALCQVDVVIDNYVLDERSVIVVNSSAHRASFAVVPVVANRQGLISFTMPPIPDFFSQSGTLNMLVSFSDSSHKQLPLYFVSAVPSPYISSATPSRIARGADTLIRVIVANVPENVESNQIFVLLGVTGSFAPFSNYSVARIEFVSAFIWIQVSSNDARYESIAVAIQIRTPLSIYTTEAMMIETYKVTPACELQRDFFFTEDSGRPFYLHIFVASPVQLHQALVVIGDTSVQILNVTNIPFESGEWNVTMEFLLPKLNSGIHAVMIQNSAYKDYLTTSVQVSSLSSPILTTLEPSVIPIQGSSIEIRMFDLFPYPPVAILIFDNNCANVSLPSKLIRHDISKYLTIHLQVPSMTCRGPANLLIFHGHSEHSQHSVVVYDPQVFSVLSVSPSLVSSAGGSFVTLSIHCGTSSFCKSDKVSTLAMYIKLHSAVVSKCSSVTLTEQTSLLKCTFVAPALALETTSRKLVYLDLLISNFSSTLQVPLYFIRRMPRVILCNVSSSSIAFINANRFASVTFQFLNWNPRFRAEIELPSAKLMRLATLAHVQESADTTLLSFLLPNINSEESGAASFIFQSSGSPDITFSTPVHIFSSSSMKIVRVSPSTLASASSGSQLLKIVVFGASPPTKVSLMHMPSLKLQIVASSSCEDPASFVGFNVLSEECHVTVASLPPGNLLNVTNVTLVVNAGSLQAKIRVPVTLDEFRITKLLPPSLFDCDMRNTLLNISFTSSVRLTSSQIDVRFGSMAASISHFESFATSFNLVAITPQMATAGIAAITLIATTNSSTMKTSSDIQVIKCCADIIAHCKTLNAIAVPPAQVDATFGTRPLGGCDSSVCQQSQGVARAAIIENSEYANENGGLFYFLIRNFPLRSSADITITAINQVAIARVQSVSFLTGNIVNITATLSPFIRAGPRIALQLSTLFGTDSLRASLIVIPSFSSDPVIISVVPSLIAEVVACPITVTLTNFPRIQNESLALWSLSHPSSSVGGTVSVIHYSSASGDTQVTIQLPADAKRMGTLNFTLHVWVDRLKRGAFVLTVLPRSPRVVTINPFAFIAATPVSVKMVIIAMDFPQFTQLCNIFVQNIRCLLIEAVTNSVNGRLQRISASLAGVFLPGVWPVIISCPPASASFDVVFYGSNPIISSVAPSLVLNSGSEVIQVFVKNLGLNITTSSVLYVNDVPVQFNVASQTANELVLQFQSQIVFPIGSNAIKYVIPGISQMTSTFRVEVASPVVSPDTVPAGASMTFAITFFEPRKFLRVSELSGSFEGISLVVASISLRSSQTIVACVASTSLMDMAVPRTGKLFISAASETFTFMIKYCPGTDYA